jgi:hypothetical protein
MLVQPDRHCWLIAISIQRIKGGSIMRKFLSLTLALVFLMTVAPVLADAPISIEIKSVGAAVIGTTWGSGVLTFGDKTHTFQVRGLTTLKVGAQKISCNGKVYKLKSLDDLVGRYKRMDKAGVTFIKDEIGLVVQNEKGVVLNLKAVEKGMELDLVSEGLTVRKLQ